MAVLNDSHATPEQKQAAYAALSGYVSAELGIPPAQALLAVVDTFDGGRRKGAYANGTFYIDDREHTRLEDVVTTVGHETQHHIDAQRGHQGEGETYDDNREQYAEVMGEATQDYLSFNYGNADKGEFGGWNTQTGTKGSELIAQNQSHFESDRQSGEMDFRLPNETEQSVLKKLAGDDPDKQYELLSAACAMTKCSRQFVYGTENYEYYKSLEKEGANYQEAQTVLANYSEKSLEQGRTYPAVQWVVTEGLFQDSKPYQLEDAEQLALNYRDHDARVRLMEITGLTCDQVGEYITGITVIGGVLATVIEARSGKVKKPSSSQKHQQKLEFGQKPVDADKPATHLGTTTEKQQKPSEPTFKSEPESVLAKRDVDGQGGDDGRMPEASVDLNSSVANEVTALQRIKTNAASRTELNQQINLRGATAAEYDRQLVEGVSFNKMGPALAGVMDTKTGQIFFGRNTGVGEIPSILSPDMRLSLEQMPDKVLTGYIKTKGAGTHAEVHALNEAMLARPGSIKSDFLLQVINSGGSKSTRGSTIPRCPHCAYLTNGAKFPLEPPLKGSN
ncbi:YwqJ-related putative deaminase [Photobacterium sp. R1]